MKYKMFDEGNYHIKGNYNLDILKNTLQVPHTGPGLGTELSSVMNGPGPGPGSNLIQYHTRPTSYQGTGVLLSHIFRHINFGWLVCVMINYLPC